jgi:ATP-dependent Clp protease ATP-binding subunit ClpC
MEAAMTDRTARVRGPFDRFDERANRVFGVAKAEASLFRHNYIGSEHLLLGVVSEENGEISERLAAMRISVDAVRRMVGALVGPGDADPTDGITLSPLTKMLVDRANDESRRLGHPKVSTRHILLAILLERGVGAKILETLGVSLDELRSRVELSP